ncbi:DUF692 domain-containing protein [Catellatospora sp. KI3]|uniref:DUF692 domain-containing protein n=1 Tax=Catellatospora sp. KI3 TaxID=3041620 RepID=UPI0024823899|nr:DUF692 domain-containing protein [Catellatospora sp. KI3]MDI1460761.1 DUF692 domain-containing protein [Catellatospora sp. KI3]
MPLIGVGYRSEVGPFIRESMPPIEALEITVDHCIRSIPEHRRDFRQLPELCPVFLHGVGLSLGTAQRPDSGYLSDVRQWAQWLGVPWYSEHLAFTKVPGLDHAQLLPLPRTEQTLRILCDNIDIVQDGVGLPVVLENISYYFDYHDSEVFEADFLAEVCNRTGAGILLDLENLRINSSNHGYDAGAFLAALPPRAVRAIHLAGGCESHDLAIDTHDRQVSPATFALLPEALRRHQPDAIIIERDQAFEGFMEVLVDVEQARRIRDEAAADLPRSAGTSEVPPPRPTVSASARRRTLFDRQRSILEHLSNPAGYASAEPLRGAPGGVRGDHLDRLALVGSLVLAKRWEKIKSILPATCRCLDAHAAHLIREFAAVEPPRSPGRRENARQLHDFIVASAGRVEPDYLVDLVRLEHMIASATFSSREREQRRYPFAPPAAGESFDLRSASDLKILKTPFDLKRVLDGADSATLDRGPDQTVAVVPGADSARVFWLDPGVAALLLTLDDWTTIHAAQAEPIQELVLSLAAGHLIEVRPCVSA